MKTTFTEQHFVSDYLLTDTQMHIYIFLTLSTYNRSIIQLYLNEMHTIQMNEQTNTTNIVQSYQHNQTIFLTVMHGSGLIWYKWGLLRSNHYFSRSNHYFANSQIFLQSCFSFFFSCLQMLDLCLKINLYYFLKNNANQPQLVPSLIANEEQMFN